jgi:hypothetical protein
VQYVAKAEISIVGMLHRISCLAQCGDQYIELVERHTHSLLHPRGERAFQRFLAGEKLMQSKKSSALALLEGGRDYGLTRIAHPLIDLREDQP